LVVGQAIELGLVGGLLLGLDEQFHVTEQERTELKAVASMLGLASSDVETALHAVDVGNGHEWVVGGFSLQPGHAVVFTGGAPGMDRDDLAYQARALGLRVTGAVSGKTHLVVAADPDSLSGKARKARDLGVPIEDYATYVRLLVGLSP
jgi:DNA polymerase-3 subunit epsilon